MSIEEEEEEDEAEDRHCTFNERTRVKLHPIETHAPIDWGLETLLLTTGRRN